MYYFIPVPFNTVSKVLLSSSTIGTSIIKKKNVIYFTMLFLIVQPPIIINTLLPQFLARPSCKLR